MEFKKTKVEVVFNEKEREIIDNAWNLLSCLVSEMEEEKYEYIYYKDTGYINLKDIDDSITVLDVLLTDNLTIE